MQAMVRLFMDVLSMTISVTIVLCGIWAIVVFTINFAQHDDFFLALASIVKIAAVASVFAAVFMRIRK